MSLSRQATRARSLTGELVSRSGLEQDALSRSGSQHRSHYWPDSSPHSAAFAARFPDSERLIAMARLAVERNYQFWHPWHMEPTHAPEKAVNRKRYISVRTGDPEWTHALLRFSHLFDLAAAYALTKERCFVEACFEELLDYATVRISHSGGAILHNRLDAALRVHNLVRAHDLIASGGDIPSELPKLMEAIARLDCRFLADDLGKRVGNWEFFISSALLVAGGYFSDWVESSSHTERAGRRLSEIFATEISGDFVEIEEAPMYSGECILTILDFLLVRASNGRELPREITTPLGNMMAALNRLKDPRGRIPPIGDSDVLDIQYLNRYAEIVLGGAGNAETGGMPADDKAETVGPPSQLELFPDTGWGILRWHHADIEWYLLFDASGRPPERRSWHAHADDLQILLHSNKADLFVDPGRYTYASHFSSRARTFAARFGAERVADLVWSVFNPRARDLNQTDWRGYFRHTLRHNTVSCGGESQPGYESPRTPGTKRGMSVCRSHGPMTLMEGMTIGRPTSSAATSSFEYEHRRRVLAGTPNVVIVIDDLRASEPREWVASWHLHPEVGVRAVSDRIFLNANGMESSELFFGVSVGSPDIQIVDDWVSPVYNLKIPAKTVRVSIDQTPRVQMVTVVLLAPLEHRLSECRCDITFNKDVDHAGANTLFDIRENNSRLLVRASSGGADAEWNELGTDALAAMARFDHGKLASAGLLGGTYLNIEGKEIVARREFGDYSV